MQLGIASIIGLQAVINIAVVTSSMPNTGMQLPFFSYGGTSLLILLCSVRNIAEYFKTREKDITICKIWNIAISSIITKCNNVESSLKC